MDEEEYIRYEFQTKLSFLTVSDKKSKLWFRLNKASKKWIFIFDIIIKDNNCINKYNPNG